MKKIIFFLLLLSLTACSSKDGATSFGETETKENITAQKVATSPETPAQEIVEDPGIFASMNSALNGLFEKSSSEIAQVPRAIKQVGSVAPIPIPRDIYELQEQEKMREGIFEKLPEFDGVIEPQIRELESYPKAEKTWGTKLNTSGEFPVSGFKAVYFDTETQQLIKTFASETLSISRYMEGNTANLGAYFVGKIDIPEDGVYDIALSQSWASTRVMIDKHIVIEANNNSTVQTLKMKKGSYTLEAEFINDWHVVDFSVSVEKQQKKYTLKEATDVLSDIRNTSGLEIWLASVYESSNEGHIIPLTLKVSKSPVALVLNSYSTVTWDIKNPNNTNIKAIIYTSYEPGTMVKGVDDSLLKIKLEYSLPVMYSLVPQCYDTPGYFHCEGDGEMQDMKNALAQLLGNIPSGFSGVYGAETMTLPETVLDRAKYDEIQKELDAIQQKKKKSQEKPSFDTMF